MTLPEETRTTAGDRKEGTGGAFLLLWGGWAVMLLGAYYTRLWQMAGGEEAVAEAFMEDFRAWLPFGGLLIPLIVALVTALLRRGKGGEPASRPGRRIPWGPGGAFLLAAAPFFLMGAFPHPDFPAWREAASRALKGIGGAGVVWASALLWGNLICRLFRFPGENLPGGLLYPSALGFGAVSLGSLGLAWAGVYTHTVVAVFMAASCAGWLAWKGPAALRRAAGAVRRRMRKETSRAPLLGSRDIPWVAVSAMAGCTALVGALAPEIEYDALWYHLRLPRVWLEQGSAVDILHEYVSLYPMNQDLVFGAALAAGGPVAAKLMHFLLLPLTAGAVFAFTRRHLAGVSPWLAAAVFLTAPTVLWEATTAYVDLGLAFHGFLGVSSLVEYLRCRNRSWLIMTGLNAGLALGTKHLGLFLLLLTVLALFFARDEDRPVRRRMGECLAVCGIALVLALPWYVRSAAASGNPFFPDLYSLFGASPPGRWDALTESALQKFKDTFGFGRGLRLLMLPWDVTVHAGRFGGCVGPLFLLLIPGAVFMRGKKPALRLLLFFAAGYLALWASPLSSFQSRFLVPLMPLLAVTAAAGSARADSLTRASAPRGGGLWVRGGLSLLVILNLPPFTSLHEADRSGWTGWLTHVVRVVPLDVVVGRCPEEQYLARTLPSYAAWSFINGNLPGDVRVLTFGGGDHFYARRERLLDDATLARGAVWGAPAGEPARSLGALRDLSITHVLFERRRLGQAPLADLAVGSSGAFRAWYDTVYQDSHRLLCRIRPGAGGH
ncbi:MAG: phospholipid carrier-dependent glycosyltransferase [Bacteroidota bacterium]